ncbi:glucose-1-phosphate adenylyltransferase [Pseudenhygromyxa sp. WMMC2535]|uniref:glucose-1-phosphate adenylyltransferase n=1 Tax=Pseudenhygromyxa sp. WMMC2535 TaxID=2712867 RepID=UPI0015569CA3|nr:glucose-1-phosphate adenylyltransferase [Pseudenhygromyxa sp. WMMC2535]NVB42513.1 glucose-1-phosphate adenylyltransferase [Pseudenhygromyxa sp. WMMC2535]
MGPEFHVNRTPILVLAGGKGSRLAPLTCHRAKPAVPFAGRYRIVDFVLSNVINSGYRRVYVLTQFMASSLIRHINRNWHLDGIQEFIEIVPAQMRMGPSWYKGTADAVWQNVNLLHQTRAATVGIFSGDHIYKFAIDQMQALHQDSGADLTIAGWPVPIEEAHQFGVMEIDESGRLVSFQEKPKNPRPMPGDPTRALVSMGNYFFRRQRLIELLREDAVNEESAHDFGKNIIPRLLEGGGKIQVYDFGTNEVPGERGGTVPYWRDVGTLESYFAANMEVRGSLPAVNLYNRQWRIRTAQRDYPPARLVRHSSGHPPTSAIDSLVCEGAIVSSSVLDRVMLGYDTFVHPGCELEESVILSGCNIGEGAKLRRVLLDKNCRVEPGTQIGFDPEADRERFPFFTSSGIVVLPKGTVVPRSGPIRLTFDMAALMRRDPDTKAAMQAFEGRYDVTDVTQHSHHSSGPRYES